MEVRPRGPASCPGATPRLGHERAEPGLSALARTPSPSFAWSLRVPEHADDPIKPPVVENGPVEPLFAILAGGRGTRMGGGKASAELGGRPLISYPLEAAHAANAEIVIVAKPDTELPPVEVPILSEPERPIHPLRGIVTALQHAEGRPVVALAADMPFLTGELLAWIERLPDPLAVPSQMGRLHPLPGRYGPSLLDPLTSAMNAERALRETVASLGPRELTAGDLARFGDPERLLLNVNTPEDLARAEADLLG